MGTFKHSVIFNGFFTVYYHFSAFILKVPTVVAIFVVITSVYLVLAPIIHYPRVEFLYAALFIAGGLFVYFPFVYYKQCRLPLDPYIGK